MCNNLFIALIFNGEKNGSLTICKSIIALFLLLVDNPLHLSFKKKNLLKGAAIMLLNTAHWSFWLTFLSMEGKESTISLGKQKFRLEMGQDPKLSFGIGLVWCALALGQWCVYLHSWRASWGNFTDKLFKRTVWLSPFKKRMFYRKMTGMVALCLGWVCSVFALFCLMLIQVFPPILISGGKKSASCSNLFKTTCQKCFGSGVWFLIWLFLTIWVWVSVAPPLPM